MRSDRVALVEAGLTDRRCRLRLVKQRASGLTDIRQTEAEQIDQSGSGQDAFDRHPAVQGAQEGEQTILLAVARCKADVAAFRGLRLIVIVSPVAQADAKAGARAERDPRTVNDWLAGLQCRQHIRFERVQPRISTPASSMNRPIAWNW